MQYQFEGEELEDVIEFRYLRVISSTNGSEKPRGQNESHAKKIWRRPEGSGDGKNSNAVLIKVA